MKMVNGSATATADTDNAAPDFEQRILLDEHLFMNPITFVLMRGERVSTKAADALTIDIADNAAAIERTAW